MNNVNLYNGIEAESKVIKIQIKTDINCNSTNVSFCFG